MKHLKPFIQFILESNGLLGVLVNTEDLKNYGIPENFIEIMDKWEVRYKSPWSNTFYSSTDIGWNRKPDGCYRVSDHWNFMAHDSLHCPTDTKVLNNSHITLGKYNKQKRAYEILLSQPTEFHTSKMKNKAEKLKLLKDPELIARKKALKDRILNKEIVAEITYDGKTYRGVVKKYTGNEIRLEDKDGNLIFGENYLYSKSRYKLTLYDKSGNEVKDILTRF